MGIATELVFCFDQGDVEDAGPANLKGREVLQMTVLRIRESKKGLITSNKKEVPPSLLPQQKKRRRKTQPQPTRIFRMHLLKMNTSSILMPCNLDEMRHARVIVWQSNLRRGDGKGGLWCRNQHIATSADVSSTTPNRPLNRTNHWHRQIANTIQEFHKGIFTTQRILKFAATNTLSIGTINSLEVTHIMTWTPNFDTRWGTQDHDTHTSRATTIQQGT